MTGGPSNPAAAASVAVVSPQFCVGYTVDLTITRKAMTLQDGTFVATDLNGNLLFQIKGKLFSLHDRRLLLDAAGNRIITFQQKLMTAHRRWNAFRGESTDSKDLIFSVRKSSMIQVKTKLDVFMAANSKEDHCDFRIEGSWIERSCVIYVGETNTIVAQTSLNKCLLESIFDGDYLADAQETQCPKHSSWKRHILGDSLSKCGSCLHSCLDSDSRGNQ